MMSDQKRKGIGQRKNRWLRSLCATCAILILLTACVGCTSLATSDEVAALESQLSDAAWRIDALTRSNEAAQQEIDTYKASNAAAQNEIDALKANNQVAQNEIGALKASYQAAQDEIGALKASNQAAQDEIGALKASNTVAQNEIDTLKASNAAAQNEIDTLKASNAAAQNEIDALKSSQEAALAEIERLKEQLKDLQENTTPSEKIKIYIDQGHNPTSYHNAGASGNGLHEQDLTFEIGCLLAQLLEEDGRFEICLSRPTADTVLGTDNTSSLEARVQGAKDFAADYFISLHINAFGTESANGIEVFVAEQDGTSYDFGNSLLQGLLDSTGLRDRGMQLGPDLYVLKNATVPAVLLEMGFISNPTDAALLAQSPELFAQGIYDGILAYFELTANAVSAI